MNKAFLTLVFSVGLLTVAGINAGPKDKQNFFHQQLERRVDQYGNETFYHAEQKKTFKADGKGGYIEIKETLNEDSTHVASTAFDRAQTRFTDAYNDLKGAAKDFANKTEAEVKELKEAAKAKYQEAVNAAKNEYEDVVNKIQDEAAKAKYKTKFEAEKTKADAELDALLNPVTKRTWGQTLSNFGAGVKTLTWTGNNGWNKWITIPVVTAAVIGAYYYWKAQQEEVELEEQQTQINIIV